MNKTIILLFLLFAFLSGCANWERRIAEMEERFHGKHVDVLFIELGVPTKRVSLSDGGQVIEFVSFRKKYRCEDKFIVNSKGIVIASQHGGQKGCAIYTQPPIHLK